MNAKGDANRSVRVTKQKLYRALIQLLQEKDVRDITVRELTELAHVSRGTFYFHYTDIYALLHQMEQAQLEQLTALLDAVMPDISQDAVPPALVALFRYLNDNPDVCRALYGKSWESEFTASAKQLIAEHCMGQLAPDGGTERQKVLLGFAVNGCFGSVAAWQSAANRLTPEEMADLIWRSIRAVKAADGTP